MKQVFNIKAIAKVNNGDEFADEYISGIHINTAEYKFPLSVYFDTAKITRITNDVLLVEGTISKGHMNYRNLDVDITDKLIKSAICNGFIISDACDGCKPYPDDMTIDCISCDITITTISEETIAMRVDSIDIKEEHIFAEDENDDE